MQIERPEKKSIITNIAISKIAGPDRSIKTNTSKYILPLLFNKSADVLNNPGFVNSYIEDLNKPWLTDRIFLLYECIRGISYEWFEKHEYFYDKYFCSINNTSYVVFVFNIPTEVKEEINTIKNGLVKSLNKETKVKLITFWNGDTLMDIIDPDNYTLSEDIVPIEDLYESVADMFLKL